MSHESMERLQYLLAMRATDSLSEEEGREVAELLRSNTEVEEDGFDLLAASILAEVVVEEPMPAALRDRLTAAGENLVGTRTSIDNVRPFPAASPAGSSLPGWLAAAACLLLAVVGWWPRLMPSTVQPAPPEVPVAVQPLTPAEERTQLLAQGGDVQSLEWSATEDPAATGASGDVVWSPGQQRGFMRIRRLEANEPSTTQYQLWIFDRDRDERYPVDGGVFDMPAGSDETVVPIDAKVFVNEPYLFAVTVEPPGGVVVSDRERIVLLAQAST